ncbi:hypothetical protein LSH36_119g08000 [Paralvinella palmiformis]|uniref:TAR DNA-binding protein 43 n=1 Tax=Paralvinella palmiformis TaxID=53620 RepID=A0AAD9JZX2_9ANNE|nr:hypothetical protein LSH36_119g08000 [Paralvinella palmiformis]
MKYRNPETGGFRGLRLVENRIHPPPEGIWGNNIYVAVFPKEQNKRKGEDGLENPSAKTKRVDRQKCSDLIVLGLPWKSTEEDIRSYFSKFGELLMVQVKRDVKTGQSKGFGFVRFGDYEAQLKCLSQRHMIDGRWCDVRIPNSKAMGYPDHLVEPNSYNDMCLQEGSQQQMSRKVFIGRCTEDMTADDLRSYFSNFGEVLDVFIPKPFRAFAFVTFSDPEVAQSLCGEDHIIKGASVHISNAAPKSYDKQRAGSQGGFSPNQGFGSQGNWGGSMGGKGSQQGNMGGPGGGNMANNPLLNNLGAAFQLNPAMVAAAQAALSQGGWGLLGMMNQGQGGQGGSAGVNQGQQQAGQGSGDGNQMQTSQGGQGGSFGNLAGSTNQPATQSGGGFGSFGGWNGSQGSSETQGGSWGGQTKSGW